MCVCVWVLCTSAYVCLCVCQHKHLWLCMCAWPDKGIWTLFRGVPSKHSSHPFIPFYLVLVVLVVSQVHIRYQILQKHTHKQHTLRGCLILAVSLPVYSSNQCWHTALCGTEGQLEDTHRFSLCHIDHLSFLLTREPVLFHFVLNLPAACQSCSVYCVSVRSAWFIASHSWCICYTWLNETFLILNPSGLSHKLVKVKWITEALS